MGKLRRWDEDQLKAAVLSSTCKSEVLRKLGLGITGGNFGTLNKYVERMGLDISHFDPYRKCGKTPIPRKPLSSILVEGSNYPTWHLKNRLLKKGILEKRCSRCGLTSWQGEEISLHLDHINGRCRDHRLNNLRLLCPNCHAQTENYCGKALTKPKPKCKDCGASISRRAYRCRACVRTKPPRCIDCGALVSRKCRRCRPCAAKIRRGTATHAEWPPVLELERMVAETSFSEVGRSLGVSDNAVRKHLKKRSGASRS